MRCCIADLRDKDVINKADGSRLGNVVDVEMDTCSGKIISFTVLRCKCFSLFSRDELHICWEDIDIIGDDTILVCFRQPPCCDAPKRRGGFWCNVFR